MWPSGILGHFEFKQSLQALPADPLPRKVVERRPPPQRSPEGCPLPLRAELRRGPSQMIKLAVFGLVIKQQNTSKLRPGLNIYHVLSFSNRGICKMKVAYCQLS